jgi:argininosuccinate synthase
VDRIGQLTMRNLDIADSRAKLELYAAQGTLLAGQADLIGAIEQGRAAAISELGTAPDSDVESAALRSAMDSGTD